RCDGRYLALGALAHEAMFFENLRVGPASRAVELRHPRRTVFHRHLVDAGFITVERDHSSIADEPDAVQRVEHDVRRQAGERRDMIVHATINTQRGSGRGCAIDTRSPPSATAAMRRPLRT